MSEDNKPTARNPGGTPPGKYYEYLDIGGELAQLDHPMTDQVLGGPPPITYVRV